MPRCIICDYCSEFDESDKPRAFNWDEKEHGYICKKCKDAISFALDDFLISDFLSEDPEGLGSDEFLEVTGMDRPSG
jgi:hypothetical protein